MDTTTKKTTWEADLDRILTNVKTRWNAELDRFRKELTPVVKAAISDESKNAVEKFANDVAKAARGVANVKRTWTTDGATTGRIQTAAPNINNFPGWTTGHKYDHKIGGRFNALVQYHVKQPRAKQYWTGLARQIGYNAALAKLEAKLNMQRQADAPRPRAPFKASKPKQIHKTYILTEYGKLMLNLSRDERHTVALIANKFGRDEAMKLLKARAENGNGNGNGHDKSQPKPRHYSAEARAKMAEQGKLQWGYIVRLQKFTNPAERDQIKKIVNERGRDAAIQYMDAILHARLNPE